MNRDRGRHRPIPTFLRRLRNRQRSGPPRWLDWNVASLTLLCVLLISLLWLLSPILAPFLAATMLAYMLHPFVSRLGARGYSRSLATMLAVFLLMLAVVLLLFIIVPLLSTEIAQLAQLLPGFGEKIKSSVVPWLNSRLGIELSLDPGVFRQVIQDNIGDAGGVANKLFASIGSGGLALLGAAINLALIPVVLFYVLRDWETLLQRVDALVPRRWHQSVAVLVREVDAVLAEFLRGQIAVILIMAVFYVVGLWAVGLTLFLPVGLITGLLVFVPYVGVGLGVLLGSIAAAMQGAIGSGGNLVFMVWGVFAAGQIIEGFFVTPKLVGERIGLHPVAVIFALLAFGQLFGFFGVLLALPASAAILVALRHGQSTYLSSAIFKR